MLISLDTVRADALSCYSTASGPFHGPAETTPVIDALARDGVRFASFFAHAPSTLSSHASMMTGLDPHGHAVVRNGFALEGSHPTLAERLGAAGYDPIAIVGSAALEASMGLDRGFRVYDDSVHKIAMPGVPDAAAATVPATEYQATAEEVVARTFTAVDARPDPAAPLFLFAHFYDAHAPYAPPPAFDQHGDPGYAGGARADGPSFRALSAATRKGQAATADLEEIASLYLGEVSYVDHQVGVLLDGLRSRGLLDRALVVVVADHGETLADDPVYAWSHGSNVGWEVMHVPLVMRGYGIGLAERAVVRRQAGMSGLAPTLEALLGLEPSLGDGLPFAEFARAGPARDDDRWPERPSIPVFVEATRPRQAEVERGWNNRRMHRGLVVGGWGGYFAPFIDKGWRFYEARAHGAPALIDTLLGWVARWDATAPDHRTITTAPDTTRALKALGYTE